jgi:hypothetical protein
VRGTHATAARFAKKVRTASKKTVMRRGIRLPAPQLKHARSGWRGSRQLRAARAAPATALNRRSVLKTIIAARMPTSVFVAVMATCMPIENDRAVAAATVPRRA